MAEPTEHYCPEKRPCPNLPETPDEEDRSSEETESPSRQQLLEGGNEPVVGYFHRGLRGSAHGARPAVVCRRPRFSIAAGRRQVPAPSVQRRWPKDHPGAVAGRRSPVPDPAFPL